MGHEGEGAYLHPSLAEGAFKGQAAIKGAGKDHKPTPACPGNFAPPSAMA